MRLYWESVPRRRIQVVVGVVLALAAVLLHRRIDGLVEANRVSRLIGEAESTLREAETTRARHKERLVEGWRDVEDARRALAKHDLRSASASALDAKAIGFRILQDSTPWDAVMLDTAGDVEVQRGGRTRWEPAQQGMQLAEGDWLKTGTSGTAELLIAGSGRITIGAGTLLEVHRTRPAGDPEPGSTFRLVDGTLDSETAGVPSNVVTERGTTHTSSNSHTSIQVDPELGTTVRVLDGSARVDASAGPTLSLDSRDGVRMGPVGTPTQRLRLLPAPAPQSPDDGTVLYSPETHVVSVSWMPVDSAVRYRLQIARSRLFEPDSVLVDMAERVRTDASAEVKGSGSYFWRVAALDASQASSEWSATRRFRVLSDSEAAGRPLAPPSLLVKPAQLIGENLVRVAGQTDPGASVTVNGEPARPEADGSFQKIVPVKREGRDAVRVRAVNGSGGVAERTLQVGIRVF